VGYTGVVSGKASSRRNHTKIPKQWWMKRKKKRKENYEDKYK
jgi:hypothetical protein